MPQLEERRPAMSPQLARRVALLGAFALVLFAALFFRLWFLQILSGDDYVSQASENRVRKIKIEAPRGDIVDRNGNVLVKTRQAAVVQLLPGELPEAEREAAAVYGSELSAAERDRLAAEDRLERFDRGLRREGVRRKGLKPRLERQRRKLAAAANQIKPVALPPIPADPEVARLFGRLGEVLDLKPREIHRRVVEQYAMTPYAAITIKTDVGRSTFDFLKERQDQFPGINPEIAYLRQYPYKEIGAHLFGYIGEVSPDELKQKRFKDVTQGERVGKAGLEYSYDRYLRGQDGFYRQVVDALGEPCDDPITCPTRRVDPQQGRQLQLTLDMDLQETATQSVLSHGGGLPGAFVAMDPRNGEVLALGSVPSYDANDFARPITQKAYDALVDEDQDAPILNRAIQSGYPAASTFKLITAVAAMQSGTATPGTIIQDNGSIKYGPTRFQNAGNQANGPINMIQALVVSSDVYFYEMGYRMYSQAGQVLQTWARKLGLGRPTGIDLPNETGGLIPDRQWRDTAFAEYEKCRERAGLAYQSQAALFACGGIDRPYSAGDNVNLAVGQGDVGATPLQMAVAYSTVINGGTVPRPHLGREIQDGLGRVQQRLKTPAARRIDIDETTRSAIMDGLRGAASAADGTSSDVFADFPREVFGKTGTAERPPNPDQSWYVAYVPDASKPIVVAVTVERGGFGAETAAPAACEILWDWFDLGKTPKCFAGSSTTR